MSLNSRALHYGDGFFTTAKLENGRINLFNYHMNRLIFSAKRLMFLSLDFDLLHQEMIRAAALSNSGMMKVIITRQNGRTGGYYGDNNKLLRIIYTGQLPMHCIKWNQHGVRLKSSVIRLARSSLLSGVKHLNRLEQVMIASWIRKNKKIDEALVLDTDDNVVECCSANIFWRKNDQVFTPSLYYAGVNGVVRQYILGMLLTIGYSVREVTVGLENLKIADEIFITNSLLPIASVNTVDNYSYPDKTLFNLLNEHLLHSRK